MVYGALLEQRDNGTVAKSSDGLWWQSKPSRSSVRASTTHVRVEVESVVPREEQLQALDCLPQGIDGCRFHIHGEMEHANCCVKRSWTDVDPVEVLAPEGQPAAGGGEPRAANAGGLTDGLTHSGLAMSNNGAAKVCCEIRFGAEAEATNFDNSLVVDVITGCDLDGRPSRAEAEVNLDAQVLLVDFSMCRVHDGSTCLTRATRWLDKTD